MILIPVEYNIFWEAEQKNVTINFSAYYIAKGLKNKLLFFRSIIRINERSSQFSAFGSL